MKRLRRLKRWIQRKLFPRSHSPAVRLAEECQRNMNEARMKIAWAQEEYRKANIAISMIDTRVGY